MPRNTVAAKCHETAPGTVQAMAANIAQHIRGVPRRAGRTMARKAAIEKSNRKQKYMTRRTNRCKVCGRQRGYIRKFKLCRICFRMLASEGKLPGVTKSSW